MTITVPRLNRANQILLGLLALQLVVGLIVLVAGAPASATTTGPLVADFAPDAVTGITIRDAQDAEIVLAKNPDGGWVLPDADSFPARAQPVTTLLDTIKAMDTGQLVAQNAASHPRLKVADTAFERRVEIAQGDRQIVLYVGTSGGANGLHVRLGGQNDVYLAKDLSLFQVATRPASWVNPVYFSVPREDIVELTVKNANGEFTFRKDGDAWTLADLAEGEAFNPDSIATLLNHASSLALDRPLGAQEQDSYGLSEPLVSVGIRTHHEPEPTDAEPTGAPNASSIFDVPGVTATDEASASTTPDATYTILIGAKLDDAGYAAKASTSDYYVKITNGVANAFLNLTRESLLAAPSETPAPAATESGAPEFGPALPTATAEATGSATAEPTSAATEPAATATPTPSN
ncbi:MAG: DUF4340 domain-containing protein [Anaerolineae bacterium]|nr:DUF4340 domain-containing protein [Anaerolineae bacterium]